MSEVKETEKRSLDIGIFHIQVGYLEGKILTIADATFSDQEQRKAFKNLVKRMFREQRNHVDDIVYGYVSNIDGVEVHADPQFDK